MNKISYFFLILLTAILVFISAKPEGFDISRNFYSRLEGFDISRNFYAKPEGFDISRNYVKGPIGPTGPSGSTGPSGKNEIIVFTPGNIMVFTIGIILFIIMIILIIKLKSLSST